MKKIVLISMITFSCSAKFLPQELMKVFDEAKVKAEKVTCSLRSAFRPQQPVEAVEKARSMLIVVKEQLEVLRKVVAQSLEKNIFDNAKQQQAVQELIKAQDVLSLLSSLDDESRASLHELSITIGFTYQALLEEAGVLALWVQGYAAYEKDLADNFQHLPNAIIQKPDFRKLYEELGIETKQGIKASFTTVRDAYQKRFDTLKAQYSDDFEPLCFRPYLRVLDYIFKTLYSKMQYDAFVVGALLYNGKETALAKHKKAIEKLFTQDITSFAVLVNTVKAELC